MKTIRKYYDFEVIISGAFVQGNRASYSAPEEPDSIEDICVELPCPYVTAIDITSSFPAIKLAHFKEELIRHVYDCAEEQRQIAFDQHEQRTRDDR